MSTQDLTEVSYRTMNSDCIPRHEELGDMGNHVFCFELDLPKIVALIV
jgi:hypothetical protein